MTITVFYLLNPQGRNTSHCSTRVIKKLFYDMIMIHCDVIIHSMVCYHCLEHDVTRES